MLTVAGKQSDESTKADIIATYKTAAHLTRRFTPAASIADIDELGNVVPTEDSEVRPLNYAAMAGRTNRGLGLVVFMPCAPARGPLDKPLRNIMVQSTS